MSGLRGAAPLEEGILGVDGQNVEGEVTANITSDGFDGCLNFNPPSTSTQRDKSPETRPSVDETGSGSVGRSSNWTAAGANCDQGAQVRQ